MATPPPRRRAPTPSQAMLTKAAAWASLDFTLGEASAMQALQGGRATPDEQKRAIDWILRSACGLPDWPYRPGESDRDTNIALGRQFVGHQIMKLVNADLQRLERSDPRYDEHEPRS